MNNTFFVVPTYVIRNSNLSFSLRTYLLLLLYNRQIRAHLIPSFFWFICICYQNKVSQIRYYYFKIIYAVFVTCSSYNICDLCVILNKLTETDDNTYYQTYKILLRFSYTMKQDDYFLYTSFIVDRVCTNTHKRMDKAQVTKKILSVPPYHYIMYVSYYTQVCNILPGCPLGVW